MLVCHVPSSNTPLFAIATYIIYLELYSSINDNDEDYFSLNHAANGYSVSDWQCIVSNLFLNRIKYRERRRRPSKIYSTS